MFSIQGLRRDRLQKIENRPKIDADALASDPMREIVHPSKEEIEQAFRSDGLVGKLYTSYEPRKEQREMSMAVRDAFAASENLVVEAGTGVGKSMAYLMPCLISWCTKKCRRWQLPWQRRTQTRSR